MAPLYPLTCRRNLMLLALLLCTTFSLFAQQQNYNPFKEVLVTTDLTAATLKKDCPKLSGIVSRPDYTIDDINAWVKSSPKEWSTFTQIPAVKKLNVAWITLGIAAPEKPKQLQHSFYQWYVAANISDAKRRELFPHFPLPDLKNDLDKEAITYDGKVGTWERLYPEEYQRFLNTPELTALNPYYNGYFKLPYIPAFIGQPIELDKPQKKHTDNEILDEYNYQLKLRNWYFVFRPDEFERLYGKDYKMPDDFDAKTYREYTIRILNETKAGTYPNNTNGH